MTVKALLVAAVLALVVPAVAAAHERDNAGNTAYTGMGCGGDYISPFTGEYWVDCFVEEGYQYQSACDGTCTAVLVYRLYNHLRGDFQFSYAGWRFVAIRYE